MTSINLTIHNKGFLLTESLFRLKHFTTGIFEIVFVLDGCTDSSESHVINFCKDNPEIKTKVLFAPNVFETKANNMAIKASEGDYIIIVQDDVLINEPDWNNRLLKPLKEFTDVFAVTGNTAHNWQVNPNSEDIKTDRIHGQRWCDILNHIHHANRTNLARDKFAIRDSINRAPYAVKKADIEQMGLFDEAFAPQDMDDHDLHYRMIKKLGKFVGCYWIDWESRPEFGGTRDNNGNPKEWLLKAQNKNTRLIYDRHKDIIGRHHQETRKLK